MYGETALPAAPTGPHRSRVASPRVLPYARADYVVLPHTAPGTRMLPHAAPCTRMLPHATPPTHSPAYGGIQCLWGPAPAAQSDTPVHIEVRFTKGVRITTHVEVFNAFGGVSAL